jgi:hypothetical protein
MGKLIITIDLGNEELSGGRLRLELDRILTRLGTAIANGFDVHKLHDYNGNTVGKVEVLNQEGQATILDALPY